MPDHGTFSAFLGGCDCLRCKRAFVRLGHDRAARERNRGVDDSWGEILAELLVSSGTAEY